MPPNYRSFDTAFITDLRAFSKHTMRSNLQPRKCYRQSQLTEQMPNIYTRRGLTVVFDPSSADGWTMLWWAENEYPDRWFASPITCSCLNNHGAQDVSWETKKILNKEHIYEKTTYISIYVHVGLNAIQADAILTFIRYINTAFMGFSAIQTRFIDLMKAW